MERSADRRSGRPRAARRSAQLARATAIGLVAAFLLTSCSPAPVSPTPTPSPTPASAAPTAQSPTPVPSPSVEPVAWSDCGLGFQCATIDVPLDYADPTGPSIHIAVDRLPALKPETRIGSLLVNPGGPGESGVDFIRDATKLFPAAVRARFDIVGFDPRGVGASTEIRCFEGLDHFNPTDLNPQTPAELDVLINGSKGFADDCATNNAELIDHVSTLDAARDLDLIRASLGDAKLTYIGFSYGTLLGATYASLYPGRVRAMVLDGAIDPSLDLEQVRQAQSAAFQESLDTFLADCAARTSCAFSAGRRTRAAFDALMRSIEAHPLPTPELYQRGALYSADAWSAILGSMYTPNTWPILARGLALAADGDGSILLAMADPYRGRKSNGAYSNQPDAFAGYTCSDYQEPTSLAQIKANAVAWSKAAPDFGAIFAYSDLVCAYWSHPAQRTPAPISAAGAPPIVVVGSTGDPATPYPWAVALARQLPGARLITRKGDGHTGYPFSTCVEEAADAYLLSLALPERGLTCQTDG